MSSIPLHPSLGRLSPRWGRLALAGLVLLLGARGASAQIEYSWTTLYNQSSSTTTRSLRGIALSEDGSVLFTGWINGSSNRQMRAIRVSDGVVVGSTPTETTAFNALATDDRGYVYAGRGSSTDGLGIYSYPGPDPGTPVFTRQNAAALDTGAGAQGVSVLRSGATYYTYVADGSTVLRYDVTDPASPVLDTSWASSGILSAGFTTLRGIHVTDDGVLYATSRATGSNIVYRVSEGNSPGITASNNTVPNPADVFVRDGKVYVASYDGASSAVYVLDPTTLATVATIQTGITRTSGTDGYSSIDVNSAGQIFVADQLYASSSDRVLVGSVVVPTPTPTEVPIDTATPAPTDTPTPGDTPTPADTPTPEDTPTPTDTPTETFTPTLTFTPTATPTATNTPAPPPPFLWSTTYNVTSSTTRSLRGLALSADGATIYGGFIAGSTTSRIRAIRVSDGSVLAETPDSLSAFNGLAADDRGYLYAARLSSSSGLGVYLGSSLSQLTTVALPTSENNGISLWKSGSTYYLYVTNDGTIRRYDVTQPFFPVLDTTWANNGVFNAFSGNVLRGIHVTDEGVIYATTRVSGNNRVYRISAGLTPTVTATNTGVPNPADVDLYDGTLYVVAYAGTSSALYLLDPDTLAMVSILPTGISRTGTTTGYHGVAIRADGEVFVADQLYASNSDRILRGSPGAANVAVESGTETITTLLTGSGGVTKSGGGTLILSGTNNYTGPTTVLDGTLVIDGNQSGATGDVTVGANATLQGTGTIGGSTSVAGGHGPGFSPGLQTFLNGLTYETGSTFEWELVANTADPAARGTSYDGVNVSGGTLTMEPGTLSSLVFNGTGSTVDWSNAFWDEGRSWVVIANANSPVGLFSGEGLSWGLDSLGASLASVRPTAGFVWGLSGNDVVIQYLLVAPTPTPTNTPTPTDTPTPTPTETNTPEPTNTPEATNTPEDTATPTATSTPEVQHDSLLRPRGPLVVRIPKKATSVTKKLPVVVANVDRPPFTEATQHTIQLEVSEGDCPAGTVVGQPDFVKGQEGDQDSVVVGRGKSAKARIHLSFAAADFITHNRKAPNRCTLLLTASSPGATDPYPGNNVLPIELNVIDGNDVEETEQNVSTLDSAAPTTLRVSKGKGQATKAITLRIGNADYLPTRDLTGDEISLVVTEDCPVTFATPICNPTTTGPVVTVPGGRKQRCRLTASINATDVTTPNQLSPDRCVATLTAVGPEPQVGDPAGASSQLVIDIVDLNDRQ